MGLQWQPVPFDSKLFLNIGEEELTEANAAIENAFINEAGGHSRFPGLKPVADLNTNAPVYLYDWLGDLIAVSSGRVFRIDENGNALDVTGVPISGGHRVIFDKTENELLMAAGGKPLRLAAGRTEILSDNAPDTTHIGFIDGYVLAIEKDSGRFWYSDPGAYRSWNDLSVFSADGKPDNLNALVISPYRELLLSGVDSIEQFERLPNGDTPFFRRWALGEGISAPYTFLALENGTWGVNKNLEFVRMSGQAQEPDSDDIGNMLMHIDDWTDAWAERVFTRGQKFIVLQMPRATNTYGTRGVTALYDYRSKKWYNLFGWDDAAALPVRWPGWSIHPLWGRQFIGGNGKVYVLDADTHNNDGQLQRVLARTAHYDKWGECRIDNVRLRVKRGIGNPNGPAPEIWLRARRDNLNWTRWKKKSLGLAGYRDMYITFGPMGCATTWQFEYMTAADCELEIVHMQILQTSIGAGA